MAFVEFHFVGIKLLRRLQQKVPGDWSLIGFNLGLGLVLIVIASSGRYLV